MKSFADLSSDVIAQILDYGDTSYLVIDLWKCGNARLNTKLAQSVTTVSLKDRHWTSTSRWPKCLSELRNLRSLTIDRYQGYVMGSASALSRELKTLAPTLRHLSLHCREATTALYNYGDDDSIMVSQYPRGQSRLFDIGAYFPALEVLDLASSGETLTGFDGLESAGLPDSLRELIAPWQHYYEGSYALLPRGLVKFKFHTSREVIPDLSELPRSLEELGHVSLITSAQQIAALPRTLILSSLLISSWNYEFSLAMPPLLQSFEVDNIDVDSFVAHGTNWASALPRSLTQLDGAFSTPMDEVLISSLPRTLLYLGGDLTFPVTDPKDDGVKVNWPPNFSAFKSDAVLVSLQNFRFMPSSLTEIVFDDWYDTRDIASRVLSSDKVNTLDSLSIEEINFYAPFFPHAKSIEFDYQVLPHNFPITYLPKHLTSIDTNIYGGTAYQPGSFLTILPPTLLILKTSLDFNGFDESYHTQFELPQGLEQVFFGVWRVSWMFKLSSLRHLQLAFFGWLCDFNDDAARGCDFLKLLPSSLLTISYHAEATRLSAATFGHFSDGLFSHHLPRITNLYLGAFPNYASSTIPNLPRKLGVLHIALDSLSPSNAQQLPHSLLSLTISNSPNVENYDDLLMALPPSLEYLHNLSDGRTRDEGMKKSVQLPAINRAKTYPDPRTLARS